MMMITMIVLRLLSLLGLKSRWRRHFSPPSNKVFFGEGGGVSLVTGGRERRVASGVQPALGQGVWRGGGWGVAGFVDSGPKTLVPSASNRSTAEWTPVDSWPQNPCAIGI